MWRLFVAVLCVNDEHRLSFVSSLRKALMELRRMHVTVASRLSRVFLPIRASLYWPPSISRYPVAICLGTTYPPDEPRCRGRWTRHETYHVCSINHERMVDSSGLTYFSWQAYIQLW